MGCMGYMGYIELLKQGNTLICNYKHTQKDMNGDTWIREEWYKYGKQYICKYINCDFMASYYTNELTRIWETISKMVDKKEVTIDIIDKKGIVHKNKYYCKEMQNNGWYIERKDNQINLQEEYSAHFVGDIKICPWCGKIL